MFSAKARHGLKSSHESTCSSAIHIIYEHCSIPRKPIILANAPTPPTSIIESQIQAQGRYQEPQKNATRFGDELFEKPFYRLCTVYSIGPASPRASVPAPGCPRPLRGGMKTLQLIAPIRFAILFRRFSQWKYIFCRINKCRTNVII